MGKLLYRLFQGFRCKKGNHDFLWADVRRRTDKLPNGASPVVAKTATCQCCGATTRKLTDAGRQQIYLGDSLNDVIYGINPDGTEFFYDGIYRQ
jgi:hypothetical protein